MLLRHMCLRTGVDLRHFFCPCHSCRYGLGVPGSEKVGESGAVVIDIALHSL